MTEKIWPPPEAFAYNDVLLEPGFSDLLGQPISTRTKLTRAIDMNTPITSAAMDTVTESGTAIMMAKLGGIGFIHKNMPLERQVFHVDRVKRSESGMITNPVTITPEKKVIHALELMASYKISGIPVIQGGMLVGIVTNRDLRFEEDPEKKISEVMTRNNLVTGREDISLEEAKRVLHEHRIEKLPIIGADGRFKGLITIKDIESYYQYPEACRDRQGRLRVGAALGGAADIDDMEKRANELIHVGADVLLIDSARGHSKNVGEAVRILKQDFGDEIQIIAGNIATAEAAKFLIEAGADAVKVGVGPGSICTTRVVTGIGVPQITAIRACAMVCREQSVPCIADGGVNFSGDITKALAFADSVMIGSLLAGTDEAPGELLIIKGQPFKTYRGMGSIEAMQQGSCDRYCQDPQMPLNRMISQGVAARVPYRGPLSDNMFQLLGGLKEGMGYVGASSLEELREKARFVRVTAAGAQESHVHGVAITNEPENYRLG